MLAKKTIKNQVILLKTADEVRTKLAQLEINKADIAAAIAWARRTD